MHLVLLPGIEVILTIGVLEERYTPGCSSEVASGLTRGWISRILFLFVEMMSWTLIWNDLRIG
jgi:hypothetical protein